MANTLKFGKARRLPTGRAVRRGRLSWVWAGLLLGAVPACGAPVEDPEGMLTDTDEATESAGFEGDEVEVRVVEHIRSCGESCGTWRFLSLLTVELRSPIERSVQLEWTGAAVVGRPPSSQWGSPVTDVDLPADTWVEVPLRELTQMCGTTSDFQADATFTLELDGASSEVDGTYVESVLDVECD